MLTHERRVTEKYGLIFAEKTYRGDTFLSAAFAILCLLAALIFVFLPMDGLPRIVSTVVFLCMAGLFIAHLGFACNAAADKLAYRRQLIKHLNSERDEILGLFGELDEGTVRRIIDQRALRAKVTRIYASYETGQLEKLGITQDIYDRSKTILEADSSYSRAAFLLREAGFFFPETVEAYDKQSATVH